MEEAKVLIRIFRIDETGELLFLEYMYYARRD
jgi:hypothetical protein